MERKRNTQFLHENKIYCKYNILSFISYVFHMYELFCYIFDLNCPRYKNVFCFSLGRDFCMWVWIRVCVSLWLEYSLFHNVFNENIREGKTTNKTNLPQMWVFKSQRICARIIILAKIYIIYYMCLWIWSHKRQSLKGWNIEW